MGPYQRAPKLVESKFFRGETWVLLEISRRSSKYVLQSYGLCQQSQSTTDVKAIRVRRCIMKWLVHWDLVTYRNSYMFFRGLP